MDDGTMRRGAWIASGAGFGIGSGEMCHGLGGKRALTAAIVTAATATFLIDVSLPLGVAGGVPYVGVVLLGWWYGNSRSIFLLAAVCSALAAVGYILSADGGIQWMVLTDRALALCVIWVTAVLLAKAKSAEALLRSVHDVLERQVEARTNDLRVVNQALRESEARSRATFEQAAVGICHADSDGRFLRVNRKFCDITGYSRDELLEKTLQDITHPDDLDADLVYRKRLLADEIPMYSREKRYFRKDGSTVWIDLTVTLVRHDSGDPNYFISVTEDITERKRAEAALQRLATAVEGISEIVTLYDADDRLILFNRAFREMNIEVEESITLGMTFEELMRAAVGAGLMPEAAGREEAWLRKRLARHRNPRGPFEIARQDGTWLLVHEQRLADGGSITISQDITERRRAEDALRASEARLAGILDIAPQAIISIDAVGHIQLFNQGAETIFGYRGEEVLGQPLDALLPPGVRGRHAEFVEGFARAPETSRPMGRRGEITALRKDGGEFPAEASISKLEAGGKRLFTVLLRDMTEYRRAEESARQLRTQLAHAARLSTVGNMAAGLAHEINQPLSVIGTYADTCIRALGSGEAGIQDALADLKKISRQVSRAADIIKWLRAAVTKEEAQKTELDLNACIREVTDFLESDFRTKKCELLVDLAVSLPAVRADKVQVQQVLLNLMQNGMEAARQDAGGGCQMKIRTLAATEGIVQVEVEDDGPGVPPEIRDNLFSPFVTTKTEGLGLGLAISKSIIDAHGGRIRATSNGRRGATFAFTLPTAGGSAP